MKNNLGLYKTLVEWMKKVGGPLAFLSLTMLGGYALIRPLEEGGRRIINLHRSNKQNKENELEYFFAENGNYGNLRFSKGDKFCVLFIDKDAALIEKIGDNNSPYIVAIDFLKVNSNFK